jgi:hypothetical protein
VADGLITRSPPGNAREESLRESLSRRIRLGYRLTPWWVRVLVVFGLSRIISTVFLLAFARIQQTNPWTLSHPDYGSYAKIWDGTWYEIVAQSGYPSILPFTVDGHVGQNAWAFLPLYPALIRGLMVLTGAAFAPVAVFVSLVAAAGTALVFYRLLRRFLPEGSAIFAIVLFCVAPLSPLFQVAYAESLFLLLLATALLLLLQRRYWWMLTVIAVAAFTRPGVVAFALALGLYWIVRWRSRGDDAFPLRERVTVAVTAVASGLLGFAWPAIAAVATGRLSAYTDTELSWRADYIGYGKLFPFASWIQGANWWLPGGSGLLFLGVTIVLYGLFLVSPWVRRLPVELRLWVVAYSVYLLAVFFPQSSTFRVLLPVFPLLGALAVPRSRPFRVALVIACIVGQWVWLYYCWWVDGADWTPP